MTIYECCSRTRKSLFSASIFAWEFAETLPELLGEIFHIRPADGERDAFDARGFAGFEQLTGVLEAGLGRLRGQALETFDQAAEVVEE